MSSMRAGRHVCMVVEEDGAYQAAAAGFLAEGRALGEKTVAFGPEGSRARDELQPLAAIATDPHLEFLGLGPLDPPTMLSMFREQAALAESEGYTGLRVAADMDWLLPTGSTSADVVAFEAKLDRLVAELGTSVLCAYDRGTFDRATIAGTLCVHPAHVGPDAEPPFTLVAGGSDGWRLSGAIDVAGVQEFALALRATADEPWRLDASRLEFIDVAGMRTMADVVRSVGASLHLSHANPSIRRHWRCAGFDEVAPAVRFTG